MARKPARRRITNPLALAVLALLFERPMHPYEMAATLRERAKDASIKLNYGSLYTVVDRLQELAYIVPRETSREGRRPERTVYALTDEGRTEMREWLSDLVRRPVKEYPQFEAAISLLGVLPPDEAAALLTERVQQLDQDIASDRAIIDQAVAEGLPRLFVMEGEYELAIRRAELDWTRNLRDQIASGSLEGLDQWRAFHEGQPDAFALSEDALRSSGAATQRRKEEDAMR
ncbi:MAG TPA: helix-turn-helix transcriptional regulator [Thermomicrobiales bacterium]|nr:helix-turn-helix transcriptional regulator [Thermomicrobiales bacterium]